MSEVFTAPWYPWYVNDALTSESIELMSLAEEGAYRRALDRAWKKGSIPADPKQCAKAIGKGCPVKVAQVVLSMFFPMPNDPTRMVHDRLEQVRAEQESKYLKRSAKATIAADARWHKDATSNAPSIPQAMHKQCHSESDTDIEEKKEEKSKRAAKAADPRKDHPAIQSVFKTIGRWPDKALWDSFIELLGSTPDEVLLKRCWVAWRGKGFSPTNFAWLLEWYPAGGPQTNGTAKKSNGFGTKRTDADNFAESADFYANYENLN